MSHGRRLGRRAGRLLQLLQGSREVPAHHADRQARVRIDRAGQDTSPTISSVRRCPSGSPRASVTRRRSGPSVPRSIRCSCARTTRAGACTRSTRTSPGCARSRPARSPVPTAISTIRLAAPVRGREARHQARRHRVDLQRARHGARRRVRHRAHHARRGLHRPRRQVGPDRSPARSTAAAPSTPSCRATRPPRTPSVTPCSGFLVDVEKTDMEELKRKYPEAFEKPFHPCAGPRPRRLHAGGEE